MNVQRPYLRGGQKVLDGSIAHGLAHGRPLIKRLHWMSEADAQSNLPVAGKVACQERYTDVNKR